MGFSLQVKGASFSYAIDRLIPYVDEAAGLWLLGDANEAKVNLLTGAESTVVGTPTFSNQVASLGPSAGYDTGITVASGTRFTFIAITSTINTGASGGYVGTWHSGINSAKLYTAGSGTGNVRCAVAGRTGAVISGTIPLSPDLSFKAGTWDGTTATVYAHNGDEMLTGSASDGNSDTNTFRIGAMGASDMFRCAAAMLFLKALSAEQIDELYDYFVFKLGKRGVQMLQPSES